MSNTNLARVGFLPQLSESMTDPISPDHYKTGEVECVDALRSALGPEGFQYFCQGNVLKYVWRYKRKGGKQDLEKAKVYIDWLIASTNG